MTRDALERRILAWMAEGALGPRDDARFAALALALFAYQRAHCAPYRRLCDAAGVHGPELGDWRDIPAAPTGAFKEARLACFAEDSERRIFRTSGTTTEARGALHLDTLELYEASLRQTFGAFVCPDLAPGRRMRFDVLAPSPDAAPDSSLSYMFGVAVRELGTPDSRFWIEPGSEAGVAAAWDPEACIAALAAAEEPVAVVGTAFAFVHLLDALAATRGRVALQPGSRVMETGGFKGRSREIPRDALHAELSRRLGVPRARIVNQYGMCELGSQFYEPSLREGTVSEWKVVPPWVRTRALDPETLRDVPEGETGLLVHYDLANTGAVLAVATSDLGCVRGSRLLLRGRLAGAEARGCSRAADMLLSGA